MHELYKIYRPKTLKGIKGQPDAVRVLETYIQKNRIPHALLLTGPSGCGKTTIARILKTHLDCSDNDFDEKNCADFRGIDTIRDIRSRMGRACMGGRSRIFLLDEAHQLSKDGQNAFLKILEDAPKQTYYILCTTDASKLIPTLKNRCTEVRLRALTVIALRELILKVAGKEEKEFTEEVVDKIIEAVDGSGRAALVVLDKILHLDDEEDQLAAISRLDSAQAAIEVYKTLISPRSKWMDMSKVLKDLETDDWEGIRYLVLACAANMLLSNGKLMKRAYLILNSFRDNFYDSKRAGLVAACWEVINA